MRFLVIFLGLISTVYGTEICFPTQRMAEIHANIYNTRAKGLFYKFFAIKRPTTPTYATVSKKCNQCVEVIGDSYIAGIFQEEVKEKEKEFEKILKEAEVNIKVDVSISGLYPDQKVGTKVFFNKLYQPFLRYPGSMQNAFYDKEGTPIFVNARMINPQIMSFTFMYKDLKHTVIQDVNHPVSCFFPYEDEESKKKYPLLFGPERKFFMKEDDKMLELKNLQILSIIRDFYWPEEIAQEP